jgi:hypothetical protein
MSLEPRQRTKTPWASAPTPEERAAELARVERLVAHDMRRRFLLTLVACVFWLAVGLALMAWALHTTDAASGQIAFWSGLLAGYAGIVITLARYYLKGESAGWW